MVIWFPLFFGKHTAMIALNSVMYQALIEYVRPDGVTCRRKRVQANITFLFTKMDSYGITEAVVSYYHSKPKET